jgi:Tfp pilus assembly protein PilF
MRWIDRTRRVGKALTAGVLLGLAGCQQLPISSSHGWSNQPTADGPITPAQEADLEISMGRVAEQQGNLEQAMAAYRSAVDRDKHRTDAYARQAVLYDKQGKFRESAELYRKALASRPGDPEIFCDMGYSFYLQRRWAEAEMNLRQAIALSPEFQRAHNNLALLLVRDNRLDDALSEFRKGGSNPAQAHRNLAFALSMDQRWEPARTEYQRALALDPSSQLAKSRLDELNALLAKLEPTRNPVARDPQLITTSVTLPEPRRLPAAQVVAPMPAPAQKINRSPLYAAAEDWEKSAGFARIDMGTQRTMRQPGSIIPPATIGPPRTSPPLRTNFPMAAPVQPVSRAPRAVSRPEDSVSGPRLGVDLPGPQPSKASGSERTSITRSSVPDRPTRPKAIPPPRTVPQTPAAQLPTGRQRPSTASGPPAEALQTGSVAVSHGQ